MRRAFTASLALALALTGCAAARAQHAMEGAAPAPGASRAVDATRGNQDPAARGAVMPTPRPFTLPAPERFRLKNGVAAWAVRRAHLPIVTVRVVVRAGSALDEAATPGLAELTGELLRRGAGSRTAPQLAEAIDATGGSLRVAVGHDAATLSLTVLKRDLGRGLGLLADVLTRPRLDEAELRRLAGETSDELEAALDDGDEVADLALRRVALGGHPYGRPPSRKALARFKRADAQRFYTRWYRPGRTAVGVVGDVTPDEARRALDAALGGWKEAPGSGPPAREPAMPAPQQPTGPTIWLVDMDVNQAYVRIGAPAPARRDPGRTASRVMNFVLGADFTSRLNLDIRDKEGLAYGSYSGLEAWREAGLFSARLNTRTETTRRAVDRLLANLAGIRDALASPAELDAARDHLAGAFPLRFEANADVARELTDLDLYGLPEGEIAGFRERVRAVTAADVQAAARRVVPGAAWHLVVVGKAGAIAPTLAGLGRIRKLPRASLVE